MGLLGAFMEEAASRLPEGVRVCEPSKAEPNEV